MKAGDWFNTNSLLVKGITTLTIANYFKKDIKKYFNKIKFDLVNKRKIEYKR